MLWFLVGCTSGLGRPSHVDGPHDPPEEGDTWTSGGTAPDGAHLLINEVQPKNDSTWQDDDLSLPDWIELWNDSDIDVDLSRVTLTASDGTLWNGSGGSIAPGEHELVLPFSVSNNGDSISLAIDGTTTDVVSWGDLQGDTAWARYPDGGSFLVTGRPTPGRTNGTDPGITDPSDDVFQTSWVHEASIELSEDAVDSLKDDGAVEVAAVITIDGITFTDINVKIKGGSGSLTEFDEKPSFKVDLDDYTQHRWRGLEKLTFNNLWQDPTAVHEWLSYEQLRTQGFQAPRVGYLWLEVNGDPYGLYTWVETVDDQFLQRWFADPTGPLYESEEGTDLWPGSEFEFELDEGTESDRGDLTAVIDVLQQNPDAGSIQALGELVDLEQVIGVMAWEAAAVHFDGYQQSKNYRLYHDPTSDKFFLLPWGTDRTYELDRYGVWGGLGAMFQFCIADDGCKADYAAAISAAADHLEGLPLEEHLETLLTWLQPYIDDDERRHWDDEEHEDAVDAAHQWIGEGPSRLRDSL